MTLEPENNLEKRLPGQDGGDWVLLFVLDIVEWLLHGQDQCLKLIRHL